MPVHASLADWVAGEAIPFVPGPNGPPASIDSATDRIIAELGSDLRLLALGEALHGSQEILLIRNRMFQRLAAHHGFSAVVLEVSSPAARAINDYVLGKRERSDPSVEAWFANGFGLVEANRELVEWLRARNAETADEMPTWGWRKLRFYGFDLPLGQGGLASPGGVLEIVLSYLEQVDAAGAESHRRRIANLVGDPGDWERPTAMFDPEQSVGQEPRAKDLRIATLDLITDVRVHAPAYIAR